MKYPKIKNSYLKNLRFQKKAEININVLLTIFSAIFVIMAAAALTSFVFSVKEKTFFEVNYLPRDMSTIISTLSLLQGNVQYDYLSTETPTYKFDEYTGLVISGTEKYKAELEKFIFEFSENLVSITPIETEKNKLTDAVRFKPRAKMYPYWFNTRYQNRLRQISAPKSLTFIKNGNKITLNENPGSLNQLRCEIAKTPTFFLETNPELVQDIFSPARIGTLIINVIHSQSPSLERNRKDLAEITIRLELGQHSYNLDMIKVFYPFNNGKAQALGCRIINNILDEYPEIKGVQLVPTDNNNIVLQIGNTNYKNTLLNDDQKIKQVGSAINKAIENV